ncbi:MAG TPA: peptidoglycan editing factor PgeF [Steroidobacteraceae bacterium]|nr:peptidoglycan editing factor PgeF [Steroidobacteraceae bacterium]
MTELSWLTPHWPAPAHVRAAATLRRGGVSAPPYDSLNLALHVGDDPAAVQHNRERVRATLALPSEPLWLDQIHGTHVVIAERTTGVAQADAAVSFESGRVCVVMTADCLPVLFCSRDGVRIGAAHAGWRGLVGGVLEKTIAALGGARDLMAWFGPAIEAEAFEVGPEVREQFLARDMDSAVAFTANARGRFQADLYELARIELQRLGIDATYGGGWRCFNDSARFFSHRRGAPTGRMATLIWRSA